MLDHAYYTKLCYTIRYIVYNIENPGKHPGVMSESNNPTAVTNVTTKLPVTSYKRQTELSQLPFFCWLCWGYHLSFIGGVWR